jgi:hypothetical protein
MNLFLKTGKSVFVSCDIMSILRWMAGSKETFPDKKGREEEYFQDTASWQRMRAVGTGLMLLSGAGFALSDVAGVVEASNGLLALLGAALVLISDRRCVSTKRSFGNWLLKWKRLAKGK